MSIKKNKLRNRFKKPVSAAFEKINSSIEFDKFLFNEDIDASIACLLYTSPSPRDH